MKRVEKTTLRGIFVLCIFLSYANAQGEFIWISPGNETGEGILFIGIVESNSTLVRGDSSFSWHLKML